MMMMMMTMTLGQTIKRLCLHGLLEKSVGKEFPPILK